MTVELASSAAVPSTSSAIWTVWSLKLLLTNTAGKQPRRSCSPARPQNGQWKLRAPVATPVLSLETIEHRSAGHNPEALRVLCILHVGVPVPIPVARAGSHTAVRTMLQSHTKLLT